MLGRVLPQRIDNVYQGARIALWLFGLVLMAKGAMGLNSIFNGYRVASSADGIPLDTFPPAAAQTVVSLFALWGLAQVMFCLLGILVLVRYRAMVPLMFAFLLLEHLSRKLILQFQPVVRSGTAAGYYVNLGLLAVMVVGLVLAFWRPGNAPASE